MPQFLFAVHHAKGAQSKRDGVYADEQAQQNAFAQVDAFNTSLANAEKLVFACGLEAPETAVTFTPEDPDTNDQPPAKKTEGPAADADFYLGGFWIVEAKDRDEALALGEQAANACGQRIEVRQLQDAPQ